jgi:diguanylate cyclase (GGDEF)-like protein
MSLARRLGRSFLAIGLLIATTLGLTGICFAAVLGHYEPSINELLAGRDAIDQSHSGMLDEETAIRAYLDTGSQLFLQPYYLGEIEVRDGDRGSLDLATRTDLVGPILNMRIAQQRWLSEWATPALAFERAVTNPAAEQAFLLQGRALFDTYRATNNVANTIVDADISAQQSAEHDLVVIMLGAVVVALLITIAVARRQHGGLRRAVIEPVDELLSTMRRVGSGDLSARPVTTGPPELREVASELARMTDTLVEERSRIASLEVQARSQAARLGLIVNVGREISGSLNLRYVAEAVCKAALSIGGYEEARIWLTDDEKHALSVVHDTGTATGGVADRAPVELGEGLVGRTGQYGRTLGTLTVGALATEYIAGTPVATLALPMIVGARIVGVLELASSEPVGIDASICEVMTSLTGQGASAIEAARFHHDADELSHTDALTRLPNRRRLEVDLDAEVARSNRYGRPIAFIMLDVDLFKRVNDIHGHQAGDEILSEFETAFKSSLRETDTAYRYGGEEFCVLLRETDVNAAMVVAERLRIAIAQRFAGDGGSPMVTASLGVAGIPTDATDARTLIAAADQALYAAKAAGRNRVVRAGGGTGVTLAATPPTGAMARRARRATRPHITVDERKTS